GSDRPPPTYTNRSFRLEPRLLGEAGVLKLAAQPNPNPLAWLTDKNRGLGAETAPLQGIGTM
ncbi:MAG: hypothetical protein AB4042_13405, partial [Leptolyngbyaceae cyanobacterium]